jgi:hypothetical protein
MPRGKKNIDPSLESDIDLMTLRLQLEYISQGAQSPLTLTQISRLGVGVFEQYRGLLNKNDRAKFEASASRTSKHALVLSASLRGELNSLLRMYEKGFITNENANRHLVEIDFVEDHYIKIASKQVAGLMANIQKKVKRIGSGAGPNPANYGPKNDTDWAILGEIVRRFSAKGESPEELLKETLKVVKEAIASGQLPSRGSTPKENIDTHMDRFRRYANGLLSTSPK